MQAERSAIPNGLVFSELFFSRHRGVLLALFRTQGQVALGRLFGRTLDTKNYQPIPLPEANLSAESVILSERTDAGLLNTLRFDGLQVDWHALYSIDLGTLKIAPLVSKTDLRLPDAFDEGSIFDVVGTNIDCSTIDCTVFLRNSKTGDHGWYLCSLAIPERTCRIIAHLNHGRF